MVALIAAALLAAAPAEKPRLIVTDLATAGGLDPALGSALAESVAQEVASRGVFTVVSSHEVTQLIGLERQKELMGCADEAKSCLSELAGALDARFVLTGTLAKLGDAYQLTLQMIDNEKARPVGRASRIVQSLDEFKGVLPYITAEATGVRAPEPPARWPAYTGYALGALSAIAGVFSLLQAVATETAIQREFQTSAMNPAVLRPLSNYRADLNDVLWQRTASLGLFITAGALVVVSTLYLYFTHQLPGTANYYAPSQQAAAGAWSFW